MKKLFVYLSIGCIVSILIILTFFINKSDTKTQEIPLRFKKTYSLSEDIASTSSLFVKNDKLFILDNLSKILFALNYQFKIEFRLDKYGKGPGEFLEPLFAYDNIAENHIVVIDIDKLNEMHFDYLGNYLSQTPMEDFEMCYRQLSVKDAVVKNIFQIKFEDNKMLNIGKIVLESNENMIILSENIKAPEDFALPIFCCSDESIYISQNSENQYKIDVFDNNGNFIRKITKTYYKIKKEQHEVEYEMLKNGDDGEKEGLVYKEYHLSIRQIFYYNKNLWVLTQDRDSAYFDIIDREGNFVSQVALNRKITGDFFIIKCSICELIINDDETFKVNTYF
ncbi:MAG: hypothetical protein K8S23_04855 [Candidatus Cloacimonetes bacterium]|nr:hypothetical protein [Candidatus Cloacimonadota bacterium]